MKNISFFLTQEQVKSKTKFVTRRECWKWLVEATERGERPIVQPVVKGQGMKRGETIQKIGGPIRILSARRERLSALTENPTYGKQEAILEGFPELTGGEFVAFYCDKNSCAPSEWVTRIQFEYL